MLVYGTEAILPLEVELPALRMATTSQLSPDQAEYIASQIASLEVVDERRRSVGEKLQKYHEAMSKKYNQHVEPCKFNPGMLVLCNTREVRACQCLNLPRHGKDRIL